MKAQVLCLLAVVVTSGCATPPELAPAVERTPIRDITDMTLERDYAAERPYQPSGNQVPKLGLALSGGGTKAAMFAHGVLHGLQNGGILQRVDAISTVSGGGYTAFWYFSKLLEAKEAGFSIDQIFADCMPEHWTTPPTKGQDPLLGKAMVRAVEFAKPGNQGSGASMPKCGSAEHWAAGDPYRWQSHIVRWPDVFGTVAVFPDGSPQFRPRRELNEGLFNGLVLEPLKLAFTRQSAIPELYQWGIERTWGLNPEPRKYAAKDPGDTSVWHYTNGKKIGEDGPWRVDPDKVTWKALQGLYQQGADARQGGPIPIWIVNANAGGKTRDAHANTRNNFEMTPFGSGGEKFGYVNNIERPVITDLGTSVRASAGFADAQGLVSWKRRVVELLSLIWPGVRWGVPAHVATTSGKTASVRLSDGGGAENLGVHSLLKRGVKDIIVVDAAQDVEGAMSDLCELRTALAKDDIDLDFPRLNEFARVCAGERAYNVSDWSSPVVRGTARWRASGRESRLWLIKSAWDQRAVANAYSDEKCGEAGRPSCFLTVFYGHNSVYGVDGKNKGGENMAFPQLSTAGATANSSSYLFWGYRELGRSLASQLVWNEAEQRLELRGPECSIQAYARKKDDRPSRLRPYGSVSGC